MNDRMPAAWEYVTIADPDEWRDFDTIYGSPGHVHSEVGEEPHLPLRPVPPADPTVRLRRRLVTLMEESGNPHGYPWPGDFATAHWDEADLPQPRPKMMRTLTEWRQRRIATEREADRAYHVANDDLTAWWHAPELWRYIDERMAAGDEFLTACFWVFA